MVISFLVQPLQGLGSLKNIPVNESKSKSLVKFKKAFDSKKKNYLKIITETIWVKNVTFFLLNMIGLLLGYGYEFGSHLGSQIVGLQSSNQ